MAPVAESNYCLTNLLPFLLDTSRPRFPSLFCNEAGPYVAADGRWLEVSHATCRIGPKHLLHMIPSLALSADWMSMSRAKWQSWQILCEPGSLNDSVEHSSMGPCPLTDRTL